MSSFPDYSSSPSGEQPPPYDGSGEQAQAQAREQYAEQPQQYGDPGQGQYAVQPYAQAQQQGYYQQQGYPQQQMAVAPRSPAVALIISFFIPGLGSLINGRTTTGVIILCSWIVGWILSIVIVGFFIVFGMWVWGMIDAYKAAQEWNAAHGILS
jgi:TM2 domain-containing membrane protein YozV